MEQKKQNREVRVRESTSDSDEFQCDYIGPFSHHGLSQKPLSLHRKNSSLLNRRRAITVVNLVAARDCCHCLEESRKRHSEAVHRCRSSLSRRHTEILSSIVGEIGNQRLRETKGDDEIHWFKPKTVIPAEKVSIVELEESLHYCRPGRFRRPLLLSDGVPEKIA
ncbi:uncharacterized protein LOC127262404 [Andrographis paniculata]|uniref:uncharacterized protein LOC127262404 n=1 Tax=Andrographis paniculata TaxID=175694 RepID=UPI0021E7B0C5|nr:uncharacterized protein LOC127262404 [Andrographis paniculata]